MEKTETYNERIEQAIEHYEWLAEAYGYDPFPSFRMDDLEHDPSAICNWSYRQGYKNGYMCSIDHELDGWWCRIDTNPEEDCYTVAVFCNSPEEALAVALEQGWPCGTCVDREGYPVDLQDLDE
jgi:hypothetical protein